ncbi:MAG: ATP-binding cassette domain-containing protein, partial [Rickettsiales bacterium]
MSSYICSMSNFSKSINGKVIIKPTYLSFIYGAKIGIIGPNGAGKSTLLKILAGIDKEFDGDVIFNPGYKIGYLAQEPKLDYTKTVLENIMDGLSDKKQALDRYNEVAIKLGEDISDDEMNNLMIEFTDLQTKIDAFDGWNIETEIDIAINALHCPPKESMVDKLSGGEKRRVALCRLLMENPDLLLLDEPTNHLDADSVLWLETFLQNYKGTAIVVTHDRYFLDNVAKWILEIDRGNCIPWESNYSTWLDSKQKKLAQEEKEESAIQKQLKQEREWIAQNPKGRQAKSKARINSYNELMNRSISRMITSPQIIIPKGPRLGDRVIEGINISKKFNDKILLSDFSFNMLPGSIVGVIGPNGVGKSTLLNMIIGKDKPDSGEINIG